jgi:NAD(P)H-dependent flavin oxidoreductase YrpB (nitropropane dioxygenase family)
VTKGIIGVNIMLALTDFEELIKTAVTDGADLVFVSAGLPLRVLEMWPPDEREKIAARIVPVVSSARATRIIFESWRKKHGLVPAAVVVEGPLAGGHLGFKKEQIDDPAFALEKILPEVISVIRPFEEYFNRSIPVIAAGGVYTGADIRRVIRLGAAGVQMATRFVATHECDASAEFKDAYVACSREDLVIIDSPLGLPGRAIRNQFLREVESGKRMPFRCPWRCLRTCDLGSAPYCIARALTNANSGGLEQGFAFAGANAYRIDGIVSVRELLGTLATEYEKAPRG